MRGVLGALVLLAAAAFAWGQDSAVDASKAASGPLAEANALYQSGDFQSARTAYQAKLAEGLDGPTVLYNLGNASFRAGRIGEAIAYYQRALRLAPRDRDIRRNLQRAWHERKMGEPAPPAMWLNMLGRRVVDSFTLGELATTAAALWWLGAGLLAVRLRQRDRKRGLRALMVLVLACMLLVSAVALGRWWEYHHVSRGVIAAAQTQIRSGPGDSFEIVQQVHEGRMVRIMRADGAWMQVIAEGGARGWLPSSAIALTQP